MRELKLNSLLDIDALKDKYRGADAEKCTCPPIVVHLRDNESHAHEWQSDREAISNEGTFTPYSGSVRTHGAAEISH